MFYSVRNFRTSSPGDSTSNNPERIPLRRQGEEEAYKEGFQQRIASLNVKFSVN